MINKCQIATAGEVVHNPQSQLDLLKQGNLPRIPVLTDYGRPNLVKCMGIFVIYVENPNLIVWYNCDWDTAYSLNSLRMPLIIL
jgi:hypothetical protein